MTAISLLFVQAHASTLTYSTTAAQHITDASHATVTASFLGATLVRISMLFCGVDDQVLMIVDVEGCLSLLQAL